MVKYHMPLSEIERVYQLHLGNIGKYNPMQPLIYKFDPFYINNIIINHYDKIAFYEIVHLQLVMSTLCASGN